jgi:3-oxoacyl-[acyl-carrier protein] reductase
MKVALVTGGTSGIGREIVKRFVKESYKVVIFGQSDERGKSLVDELGKDVSVFYKVDVSQFEEVQKKIEEAEAYFGPIEVLINNAGITRDGLLMKMSEESFDEVMAVNVKSCYNTCRAVVRSMIRARRGKIINMSSVVALNGNAGQTNYCASKAAIIGFSKALAKEVASRGITVNCVAPGFIKSPMTDELSDKIKEEALNQIPLGRMGEASEIAELVLFLAGQGASYMTGQVIVVDGGLSIH